MSLLRRSAAQCNGNTGASRSQPELGRFKDATNLGSDINFSTTAPQLPGLHQAQRFPRATPAGACRGSDARSMWAHASGCAGASASPSHRCAQRSAHPQAAASASATRRSVGRHPLSGQRAGHVASTACGGGLRCSAPHAPALLRSREPAGFPPSRRSQQCRGPDAAASGGGTAGAAESGEVIGEPHPHDEKFLHLSLRVRSAHFADLSTRLLGAAFRRRGRRAVQRRLFEARRLTVGGDTGAVCLTPRLPLLSNAP